MLSTTLSSTTSPSTTSPSNILLPPIKMEVPFIYKYQPLLLDDFHSDKEFISLLKTLIKMDSLNIIFIGDGGSGKTTFINSIMREYYNNIKLNFLSTYNENILVINNLKDQGIIYYRNEVKTFCQTACTIPGKKKTVIMDDIDNINEQSQQVFRNYIDKYSHNVNFLSSCNNIQKVIESIQSRLRIINIQPLNDDSLLHLIKKICTYENIIINDDAIQFMIDVSNYSVRVVIIYLEKFKLMNEVITIELAEAVCTNIKFSEFIQYTNYCKIDKDIQKATILIYKMVDRGYSVMDILDNYFLFIKTTTILTENEKYKIIPLICKYITIFNNIHEDDIELGLFTNQMINLF